MSEAKRKLPKQQQLTVKDGPIIIDTRYLTNSLSGLGARYISTRDPREMVSLAVAAVFGVCGAIEAGLDEEKIQTYKEAAAEIIERYRLIGLANLERSTEAAKEYPALSDPNAPPAPGREVTEKTYQEESL
jgi:hypothetical protein